MCGLRLVCRCDGGWNEDQVVMCLEAVPVGGVERAVVSSAKR